MQNESLDSAQEFSPKRIGRTIGILFLVQMVMAPVVYTPTGLMRSLLGHDFLAIAAANALPIRVALLLLLVLGAMTLGIALTGLPLFRRHSERLAFLFLGIAVIGLAGQVIETVALRNMLSMSLMYAKPEAPKLLFDTLGPIARSTWTSAHFSNLLLAHITNLIHFILLYRFRFVPRPLAVAGFLATLISITAVTRPLLGSTFSFLMIIPTALTQVALVGWLLVRGYRVERGCREL